MELAANGMFGTGTGIGPPDPNRFFKLARVELALACPTAWALYHDVVALRGLAREAPGSGTGACDDATAQQALYTANKVRRCGITAQANRGACSVLCAAEGGGFTLPVHT